MRFFIMMVLGFGLASGLSGCFETVKEPASQAVADYPEITGEAPLAGLAPYVGKTWVSGKEGGKFHDVSKWEWAVPGRVLVITHSVNNGVYSGATVVHKDEATGTIVARYATSASFYTDGVYTLTDGGFEAIETVQGSSGGIELVKSSMELHDGVMMVLSQYKQNGEWSEIERRTYRELKD